MIINLDSIGGIRLAFPKKVIIREVGPREGMQIEKTPVSTEDKIRLVDLLSECNFPVIEVTSFVSPKWVPQMADAELIAEGFKRNPGTEYQCIYLNSKGIERAQATGKFDLEGVLSIIASETFSRKNTNGPSKRHSMKWMNALPFYMSIMFRSAQLML